MKTLLTKTGVPPALVGTMKYVDFNALIEFGLFRGKPDVKTYIVKKQKEGPLAVENTNFKAEEPDDAWEDYCQKIEIGSITVLGDRFFKMLKYCPASDPDDTVKIGSTKVRSSEDNKPTGIEWSNHG